MQLTLALGANLGDRAATLTEARGMIQAQIGPLIAASGLLETAAWGLKDQPDFLNQVIVVAITDSELLRLATSGKLVDSLHELLNKVQAIETALGRQRAVHWGPRTCDIDLVFLDDIRYEDARISLPHPWWAVRDFVGGIIRRELPWLLHEYQV